MHVDSVIIIIDNEVDDLKCVLQIASSNTKVSKGPLSGRRAVTNRGNHRIVTDKLIVVFDLVLFFRAGSIV